jgi:hypothetical protein
MSPLAWLQLAQQQAADPHPDDPLHWQADLGPGFPDLSFSPLA